MSKYMIYCGKDTEIQKKKKKRRTKMEDSRTENYNVGY